jgi:pilus assembly protein CpaB
MNRTRLMIIGLLALALGAFVSFSVYRALQAKTASSNEPGVDVVIASNDISVGSKVGDGDLRIVKFPAGNIPSGAYSKKSQVIGRGAVLPIMRGEFILPNKLAAENAGSGLPGLIPPGMRAVSVRVNEVVAVAGFVVPGTRVDVLLTGNPGAGGEQQTTTVLENVAVLAAGQRLERNSAGEPQATPVITLLVSPDDAQKLTLASNEGRIQLTLRNPLDTRQEELSSVRTTSLYRGGAPVAAPPTPKAPRARKVAAPTAPPPPSVYQIEVVKGDKREDQKF